MKHPVFIAILIYLALVAFVAFTLMGRLSHAQTVIEQVTYTRITLSPLPVVTPVSYPVYTYQQYVHGYYGLMLQTCTVYQSGRYQYTLCS